MEREEKIGSDYDRRINVCNDFFMEFLLHGKLLARGIVYRSSVRTV